MFHPLEIKRVTQYFRLKFNTTFKVAKISFESRLHFVLLYDLILICFRRTSFNFDHLSC